MEEKEKRDYWSKCGRVFFHYGKGYGTTDSLKTICLGTEDDIKKSLDTRELSSGLHPSQRQVLSEILDYRKEEGIGTADTRTADMERNQYNGAFGRKPKATRLSPIRKRLPLRSPRTKNKSLSSK